MKKARGKKTAIILCMMVGLILISSLGVLAYQGSGGTLPFTLSDGQKKFSNRNQSSSWGPPNKSTVSFSVTKTSGSGIAKTLQCVQQNNVFDEVLVEIKNVSGNVNATQGHPSVPSNRLFAYGEWKSGTYAGTAKITW